LDIIQYRWARMKITIEPETDDEKENRDIQVFENIIEFGLVGRGNNGISDFCISNSHCSDRFSISGQLEELKLRLLHGS